LIFPHTGVGYLHRYALGVLAALPATLEQAIAVVEDWERSAFVEQSLGVAKSSSRSSFFGCYEVARRSTAEDAIENLLLVIVGIGFDRSRRSACSYYPGILSEGGC
jgi:hypothetical protein